MRIFSGNYTGNGTAQSITGVGFLPVAVMLKGRTGSHNGQITISSMGADSTKALPSNVSNAPRTGAITSLDVDGFTLGSDVEVNASTIVYDYVCFHDNNAVDLHVGTYAGNATNPHAITGLGFQPDLLILANSSATARCQFRTSDGAANSLDTFGAAGGITSQGVVSLDSDGFTLGTNGGCNGAGTTFYYLAIKAAANVLKTLTYTGNGLDNVSITGAGFQPQNVWTKNQGQTVAAAWRGKGETSDASSELDTTNETSNIIQAFEADGFQVGTSAGSNSNTRTFYAVCLKDGFTVPVGATRRDKVYIGQSVQRSATR